MQSKFIYGNPGDRISILRRYSRDAKTALSRGYSIAVGGGSPRRVCIADMTFYEMCALHRSLDKEIRQVQVEHFVETGYDLAMPPDTF